MQHAKTIISQYLPLRQKLALQRRYSLTLKAHGSWNAVRFYVHSVTEILKDHHPSLPSILQSISLLFSVRDGGGLVSGFPQCGTLETGLKNSIRTQHNAIAVSMPTQPHMGEAYTFHRRWKHGRGIIEAAIELLKQKLLWRL